MPTWDLGLRARWENDDTKVLQALDELKQVNAELEKSKQGHTDTAGAAQAHGDALDGLGQKVAALAVTYLGLAKAWASFKEGTQEFMVQERALNAISNTAKQFGQDGKEAADGALALARGLEAVGFNETEVIQGTQRLMVVTRDHAQAISASSLAADVAIKTGNDYGSMLTIIQALLTNSPRGLLMAHRQLGIEATDAADALAKISAMARGAAQQLKDTTAAAAGFSTIIKERWKDLGGFVASIWAPMARFAADYEKKQEEATIELEYRFKRMIGATADADAWYAEAIKKWKEKFGIPLGEAMAKLTPADKSLEELGKKTSVIMKKLGEDVDAEVKKEEEAQKKREEALEEWWAAAQETGKTEQKYEEEKLKRENERRKTRLKEIRDFHAQELADFTAMLDKEEKAQNKFNKDQQRDQKDAGKAFAKFNVDELADVLARVNEEQAAQERAGTATAAMEEKWAAEKKQLQEEIVISSIASIADAFGAHKEVAIAEAIIGTLVSARNASQTMPFFPVGLAMMALALAEGFAQVKQIESTTIGSGGGGGGGAGAASVSMPRVTAAPTAASGTLTPSVTTSTTNMNQNAPAQVININAIDTTDALRQLQRKFKPSERAYMRSIGNRKATTIGSKR
jgi:hypothetical protein